MSALVVQVLLSSQRQRGRSCTAGVREGPYLYCRSACTAKVGRREGSPASGVPVQYRGGMKNLPLSLTVSAAAGAFTLLDPADWSPAARRAFVFVPGALAAAGVLLAPFPGAGARAAAEVAEGWDAQNSTADDGVPGGAVMRPDGVRGKAVRAALAVGAGSTVSGVQALSLRFDASMERWLVRHRVAAPRLWMAAAVALATLVMDLLQEASGSSGRGQA